ncbi:chloride channel protein [Varibaculum cambriense]|uniref:chloride channel protein n=1 Tax=Varibaculum cambriense TaxID=184870 RepID=UPI0029049008|nr:chloride channel protein [Varibaculum cambriense]MDU1224439.1 chloride channel protein [Varibaculum cambriense]
MGKKPSGHANSFATSRAGLTALAIIIGAIVGLVAVGFYYLIAGWSYLVTGYSDYPVHAGAPHGFLGLAPAFIIAVPVLSALLYGPVVEYFTPGSRGHAVPEVMFAVRRKGGRIPGRNALVKLFAASLTLGGGGNAGREGPIVMIGAAISSWIGTRLGLSKQRLMFLCACGAAAGIAATFNAPLAGACFALEVILGTLSAEDFVFIVFASVSASLVSQQFLPDRASVPLSQSLDLFSQSDYLLVAVAALVATLVGIGFSKLIYLVWDGIDLVYHWNAWFRPVAGSLLLGVFLYFFPLLYGTGESVQLRVLSGDFPVWMILALLLGRAVSAAFTISIGGAGGVFGPTLFVGACAGMAVGQLIQPWSASSTAIYGVIGMGAAFAAASRAPLTAVFIIIEMTRQYSLILPMMLAVAIATGISLFMTRSTIYTQKLHRRGDRLSDPVSATLLGTSTAADLMHQPPQVLDADITLGEAEKTLETSGEVSLAVADAQGIFQGSVSALLLREEIEKRGEDVSLSEIRLVSAFCSPAELPSQILKELAQSSLSNLPVVGRSQKVLGYVRGRDLIVKLYRQQTQALSQRDLGDSLGKRIRKRWKHRHR